MLKIFGKNNNNLFRRSQKQTYSMPQSLPLSSQKFAKCACGYDYIAAITTAGQLFILFQAKFYKAENVPPLADIATSENTLTMLSKKEGDVLVWDFDEEKVKNNYIGFTNIKVQVENGDSVEKVCMGCNQIFLITEFGKVYFFRRNQWYETKSYSNIQCVELNHRIVDVSSGPNLNLFLSYQGLLFTSPKSNPLNLTYLPTEHRFLKIATHTYNAGITTKGTLMIWGDCLIHGKYSEPTQFTKLTKKFVELRLQKQNGYALADDGQLWAWGINANGELGLSDYEPRKKPFPLVTLENRIVTDIFCGFSYAVGICQPEEKQINRQIKVIDRKISQFAALRQEGKITAKPKSKKEPIYIEQLEYEVKRRETSNTPTQPNFNKIKSVTQTKIRQYNNPIHERSLSPSLPHRNHNFTLSNQPQGSCHKPTIPQYHKHRSSWLISQHSHQPQPQHQAQFSHTHFHSHQPAYNLQAHISQLISQNQKLKQTVTQQQQLISDITYKIRILEEAIEEHERTLSSRDGILHEFQRKQSEYVRHIEQLQDKIKEIVREREKNQEVLVVYEGMKSQFQRERMGYLGRIGELEMKVKGDHRRDLSQPNSMSFLNKQNKGWEQHSPILIRNQKPQMPYFRGQILSQKNQNDDMNNNNKSRITKSANKLIAMLDISQ